MTSSDSTKTRVLKAAGAIFARKGFRSTTVREICESAEVNLASVNYYFGDKQTLYIESVVHARQMRVKQVPTPSWPQDATAEQKLAGYIEMVLERVVALKTAPWQVQLLVREILQPTEACKKLVRDYFRPFLNELAQIINEIVGDELPQEKSMKLAFSIIGQCMYYRFAGELTSMIIEEDGIDLEFDKSHLAAHITNFSLAALKNMNLDENMDSVSPTISTAAENRV